MLTAIVDAIIEGLPPDRIRSVLSAPTVGTLDPPTLERICAEIGRGKTPWPDTVECDDLEWATYLEKLGWFIASVRRSYRGRVGAELAAPSTRESDARVYVALCSLYLHAVSVAQRWEPEYGDDAIQLLSIAVAALDACLRDRVYLLLCELAHAGREDGWAVTGCLAITIALLPIFASGKHVSAIPRAENESGRAGEDYTEWQRSFVSSMALSVAGLEVAVRRLYERVSDLT